MNHNRECLRALHNNHFKEMNVNIISISLLSVSLLFSSCEKIDHEAAKTADRAEKWERQRIVDATKSFKTLDPYDEMGDFVYRNSPVQEGKASLSYSIAGSHKVGRAAFSLKYSFTGEPQEDGPETVWFEQTEGDWRSDLSLEPLGISLWVKGNSENKDGVFRFVIMEDEKMFMDGKPYDPSRKRWQYYAYEDTEILSKDGWNRLIMPYDKFFVYKEGAGIKSTKPTLKRYAGYRIEISNTAGVECEGEVCIDELRQLSSFELKPNDAMFSSVFVQLNKDYYTGYDWDQAFIDSKAVGIDTWIIQYCEQYVGATGNPDISFYKDTKMPWIKEELDYIDNMFAAALRQGVKIIFGLYPGEYTSDKAAPKPYATNLERNKMVFDEVNEKFGNHPCLGGWYITEEFHDGTWPMGGWLFEPALSMLGNYLQTLATYIKSKSPDRSVQIAPALWRGMPADLCGEWFEKLFGQTPAIDYLYLQDCGGRNSGSYYLTDPDVDLPNWYSHIKKACDKTGVKFGIDIESFKADYKSKKWDEINQQLWVAGMYTEYITNFSWVTFKPGMDAYEGYKKYLEETGRLPKQDE